MPRLRIATCIAGIAASRVLLAQVSVPARIVYAAEDGMMDCPNEESFVAQIRERVRPGSITAPGETAREYRVRVRRDGYRYLARLDFTDANGVTRTREVTAEACSEVSRAIALVTALAIDADDNGGAGTEGAAVPVDSPTPGEAPPPVLAPAPAPRTLDVDAAVRERRPTGLRVDIGLGATVSSPKAPDVLAGGEVYGRLRDSSQTWLVELGAAGERGATVTRGPGGVRFSFVGARLRACAFRLPLGGRFDAVPCVVSEVGAVVAEGVIDHPKTSVTTWVAVAPVLRVRYLALAGSLHVEGGPIFPITQNHFIFGENEPVFNVPAAGGYAALGGSFRVF